MKIKKTVESTEKSGNFMAEKLHAMSKLYMLYRIQTAYVFYTCEQAKRYFTPLTEVREQSACSTVRATAQFNRPPRTHVANVFIFVKQLHGSGEKNEIDNLHSAN